MKRSRHVQCSTSDVRRRSRAWPDFERRLAEVLTLLSEDQFLIISQKKTNRFVQFSAQGSFGLRAETVSNAFLPDSERIRPKEERALLALGWQVPTGSAAESTPTADPDGSPNYFIEFTNDVPFAVVAEMAVKTLADVLGVPHPGILEYRAFDADGGEIELEMFGLKQTSAVAPEDTLKRKLAAAVSAATGIDDLDYDEDGDLCIANDDLSVFMKILGTPPYVRFYSLLQHGMTADLSLLSRLNRLNSGVDHMTFFVWDGVIFATMDFPASLITDEVVRDAILHFVRRAGAVAAELHSSAVAGGFLLKPAEATLLQ